MNQEELTALSHHNLLVECVVPAPAIPYLNSSKLSSLTLLQRPTEKQMIHLQTLPLLREVILSDFPIDGSHLVHLAKLPNLRSLSFRCFKYGSNRKYAVELEPLKLFTGLQTLMIENAVADLQYATSLTSLRSLAIGSTNTFNGVNLLFLYNNNCFDGSKDIADHLPDAIHNFSQVTSLRINTSENLITSSDNLHKLCDFPNLVTLRLLTCGNKGELFSALYSTSITKLEVCDYNSSRACALPGNPIKLPKLQEVRLENIALRENIKVAFAKSPITRLTLAECVISDFGLTWNSISSFPELLDLSIQSCAWLNDAALQALSETPKLTRLHILQKRGLTCFSLSGLTNLAPCAPLRVLDLSVFVDDAKDITRESVTKIFEDRKNITVMVVHSQV